MSSKKSKNVSHQLWTTFKANIFCYHHIGFFMTIVSVHINIFKFLVLKKVSFKLVCNGKNVVREIDELLVNILNCCYTYASYDKIFLVTNTCHQQRTATKSSHADSTHHIFGAQSMEMWLYLYARISGGISVVNVKSVSY